MVPQLQLSLTAPGWGVLRAAQVGMSLVILGASTAAGWCWLESHWLTQAAAPYEASTQRLLELTGAYVKDAKQAGYDVSEERLKGLDQEVAFTNQMLHHRAFSWTRFLTDLEEAVPPQVSIGSVALSVKEGVSTIALTGAARGLRDLTALVNGLETHAAFRQVVLAHHQLQGPPDKADGPGRDPEGPRAVEFSLTVTYRPPL